MGIRTIIVIGLGFITVSAGAADTNSWTAGGSAPWDTGSDWSLRNAPSITDTADFITNASSKTVSIDNVDTGFLPGTLTISNLTVMGSGGATNTLNLTNMNAGAEIPLDILNTLTVGTGGKLEIINSMLQTYDGTFSNGTVLVFALGTNWSPVAVSNNLALAGTLNVAAAVGFTNTTYTLFTYGGTLTYNGLTIGTTPTNATCVVSTNTIGEVNLVVSLPPPPSQLPFQIVSITQNTNNITITWTTSAAGTNFVQAGNGDANGSYDTNNFQSISGSMMIVGAGTTNSYTDVGGATNMPSRFYRILYAH